MKKWYKETGNCSSPNYRYPCSNFYTNRITGELISVSVTPKRHCNLPIEIDSLEELFSLKGVEAQLCEIDPGGKKDRIDFSYSRKAKKSERSNKRRNKLQK
jgi:hypothetical protein